MEGHSSGPSVVRKAAGQAPSYPHVHDVGVASERESRLPASPTMPNTIIGFGDDGWRLEQPTYALDEHEHSDGEQHGGLQRRREHLRPSVPQVR